MNHFRGVLMLVAADCRVLSRLADSWRLSCATGIRIGRGGSWAGDLAFHPRAGLAVGGTAGRKLRHIL